MAAVFSVITIYDAMRLRGAVAHHARVLTALLAKHPDVEAGTLNLRIGHTPLEIVAGIVVGAGLVLAVWPLVAQL